MSRNHINRQSKFGAMLPLFIGIAGRLQSLLQTQISLLLLTVPRRHHFVIGCDLVILELINYVTMP